MFNQMITAIRRWLHIESIYVNLSLVNAVRKKGIMPFFILNSFSKTKKEVGSRLTICPSYSCAEVLGTNERGNGLGVIHKTPILKEQLKGGKA